jgi:hypothetical protein
VPGQAAEARFDVVLAEAAPGTTIAWNLTSDANAETQVEVYSISDKDLVTLVDRFVSNGPSAQFTSSLDRLAPPGRVRVIPFRPRLVLAHYYPWYTAETWRDPQMADRPPRLYSTESPADVGNEVTLARSAGIDAFVVSWQGLEAQSGFNDRRMRVVLEAARNTTVRVLRLYRDLRRQSDLRSEQAARSADGVRVARGSGGSLRQPSCVLARRRPPGHLRLPRPILSEASWAAIVARLRATGRNPLLIGDFTRSTLLEPFDGEYQYTNVFSSESALLDQNRTESLRVRTYSLLRQAIAAASGSRRSRPASTTAT